MQKCLLCGGESEFIYSLDGYAIIQCKNCKTSRVQSMPNEDTLNNYYNGFKYSINEENKEIILNEIFNKWYKSLNLPPNAKMLDIGGGNGYFSLAFEHFGYGKATYIDLDPQACKYVESLGINSVINDNVNNLANFTNEKFDFIYARHVIEHLTDPLPLIDSAINLLSDNGTFILQLPNGLSQERLTEKKYYNNIKTRLKKDNIFSNFKIFKIMHSNKIAADLAPPRHLWAFSSNGLKKYLSKNKNIKFKIKTYSIMDKVYSPFMGQNKYETYFIKKIFKPIKNILRFLYSIPAGKTHLVFEIKKEIGIH